MKNFGYIEPIIKNEDFVFGSGQLTGEILEPTGDWSKYLPEKELQAKNFETFNCTAFATCNIIEILTKRKYNEDVNYSDRFLGIVAGTRPPGNDPLKVAQAVRDNGLVPEYSHFSLPAETVDDYYSFGDNEKDLRSIGKSWLDSWEFRYDIVPTTPETMMEALRYSPLGVAVYGWIKEGEYYVRPEGVSPNHWTVAVVGYKEGQYWLIYDSYEDSDSPIKKLPWNYKFGFCVRYSLRKYTETEKQTKTTLLENIIKVLKSVIDFLTKKKPQEAPVPEKPPVVPQVKATIEDLARGIMKYENVNIALNNPGGLRSSPFQNGFIIQKSTGSPLATFETFAKGLAALHHQIRIVCNGTSPVYTQIAKKLGLTTCADLSLEQFLHSYAPRFENDTEKYIAFIEKFTKVARSTKMKELL